MLQRLLPLPLALIPIACLSLGASQEVAHPTEGGLAIEASAPVQAKARRPLDHEAYPRWATLGSTAFSRNGAWVLYSRQPADGGDPVLHVRATGSEVQHVVPLAGSGRFDPTSRWAAYTTSTAREELKRLKKEGKKEDELPKPSLSILALESGETQSIARVRSFALPKEHGAYIAWIHHEPEPKKKGGEKDGEKKEGEEGEENEQGQKGEAKPEAGAAQPAAPQEPAPQEPTPQEPTPEPTQEPVQPAPPPAGAPIGGEPQAHSAPTEPEVAPAQEPVAGAEQPAGGEEPGTQEEKEAKAKEKEKELTPAEKKEKERIEKLRKKRKDGTELVLRALESGRDTRFEKVSESAFSDDGRRLALTTTDKKGGADGVHVVDTATGTGVQILAGEGLYKSLAFDESGERLAFLATTGEDYLADPQVWTLYTWSAGAEKAAAVARLGTPGIPEGWGVSDNRAPAFSKSGKRLWLGTAPMPPPEPEEIDEEDKVTVDVWSWSDDLIQPMQLERLEQERKRAYTAVVVLGEEPLLVQLGNEDVPDVHRTEDGDSALVIGTSDRPYRSQMSWDPSVPVDVYLIEVESGARRQVLQRRTGRFDLSPSGNQVAWWDGAARTWRAMDFRSGQESDLTGALKVPFHNELHDTPDEPNAYGSGGWLADERGLLLYDRHDVWLVDPSGIDVPRCLTEQVGRRNGLRFRVVDLDREEEALDHGQPLLLEAFDYKSRDSGFWRDAVVGAIEPQRLLMGPYDYSTPTKADEGELLRFTRSSFQEFGDLWISDADFAAPRKLSDINPQQAEYLWGSAEVVSWISADGSPLEGLLFKPEGFDPSQRYPMVTYFYERLSEGLHNYRAPTPGSSSIAVPFYTSRGYLVFLPDIPYQTGYPGRSAMHAIVPGVTALIAKGFVDPDRIGMQGHSWGGYQVAYMITQTNLFAAAVSGAPVSNMTSAYGGIRYQTGMSRQFQYEKTQSRIGATLWEATARYVENSPLFYLDQVATPVVILHNDADGAVPWTQGIEMFMGLRRLGRPAWLLNYNKQGHGLGKYSLKKDYAVRMQQFFDHYLKGEPPAVWMVDGVPALKKGRDLGLDTVAPKSAAAR